MKSNIHELPITDDILFKKAIGLVEDGQSKEALDIAIDLINRGFNHANTLAGLIYENGSEDIKQDFEKAFFYYQQAANTVGAMHGWLGMARLLVNGTGVEQDYQKAFDCYSVVAEDAGSPIAWINLGRMSKDGCGTPKSLNSARAYFKQASKAGYVAGDIELAKLMQEEGNFLAALFTRLKAGIKATKIAFHDRDDIRLKDA